MTEKTFDFVVVGSGLSGCVVANQLALRGKHVLVLEKRTHIGGNVYDEYDKPTGVLVQKYGPHIFHTNSDEVWNFLSKYSEWIPFEMKCGADINGVCTPSPFNFKTIDQFFERSADVLKEALKKEYPSQETVTIVELLQSNNKLIKDYANFLFAEDYSLYTAKQWGIPPEKVDVNVLKRVPVRMDYEEKYFTDKYQYMPKHGFTDLVKKLLDHPNIVVKTNVDAMDLISFCEDRINVKGDDCLNSTIIWTGPIDRLFNYKYGLLPYRSLLFKYEEVNADKKQMYPVVAYPKAEGFTRITDYNSLPPQGNKKTIIAYEYPKQYYVGDKIDPYYPINNESSAEQYNRYYTDALQFKNLLLVGRLATYKYYNMDQVVLESLKLAKTIN